MALVTTGSLSLHFNQHFPGGPELASIGMSPVWTLLELRVMEVVVTSDIPVLKIISVLVSIKFELNHFSISFCMSLWLSPLVTTKVTCSLL